MFVCWRDWSLASTLSVVLAAFASSGPVLQMNVMGQELADVIQLPPPDLDGELSVEGAIQLRRSIRDFATKPLELADISQLLWSAQGVTSPEGYRAAPSAGALYPLEIFLVAGNVRDLSAGVYRYAPRRHELIPSATGDRRRQLAAAALNQSWMRNAPAAIVITGVVTRTAGKYGNRARRYVQMEVGHAAQNVYLQATAMGLATVLVGAFDDDQVVESLKLPEHHEPFCLMPVGWPMSSR